MNILNYIKYVLYNIVCIFGTKMEFNIDSCETIEKLSVLKAGAVFMNTDEEKVRFAVKLISSQLSEIDFIIWIAPASFFANDNYRAIMKKYGCGLIRKMRFFSIEAVSMSDDKYLQLYSLCDKYRTFCVVDDSLTIKNTEAGRTKRLLSIHKKFKFRLILSAIPLTQGLIDLYSQIKFIDSGILNMTEGQFSNCFLPFYQDDYQTWKRWSTPENEYRLIKMMKPYIYRCDIKDWNTNICYHNCDFELTPAEAESYRQEKEKFLEDKEQVAFMEVAQRFQHIYTIAEKKVEALFRLLEEIRKRREKVLIYTKYLDEIVFLKETGFFSKGKYVEMTGKSNKRQSIRMFENDVDIMLCTYRVDRLNLSLRHCDNIIYFSQTFDYKDKLQSLYNLHHHETERRINVYNFWVNTGLEGLIRDNLDRKRNVLANVCSLMSREAALKL